MSAPSISQLAVRLRPLDLSDSVGKAAEVISGSTVGAAPVALNGHVIAVLSEADLAAALDGPAGRARDLPIAALHPRPAVGLPGHWSASEAMTHLRQEGLKAAPVLDGGGRYVGMIGIAELATAMCGRLRPASIGGMATPFGVYLTDGTVRGGVGDWALVSTGIYLGLLMLLATMLATALIGAGGLLLRLPLLARLLSAVPTADLVTVLTILLFAGLFRLSWITGYHAAEHQTVHAIERSEDLRVETVRAQPRVHPRCGTNLVVGLMVLSWLWRAQPLDALPGGLAPLVAVILAAYARRNLGSLVQQYVTTRPATDEQIRSGIRAGEELLVQYQSHHHHSTKRWTRLWCMGMCQVGAGYGVTLLALWLLGHLFTIPGTQYLW